MKRSQAWFFLALLCLLAYGQSLRLGFLLDDHKIIEENARIRQWSLNDLKQDFQTNVFEDTREDPFYRPLITLSNRLDYSLWKLHAFGYHLTNLAFHIGTVWLLYEGLLALTLSPWAGIISAGLFAIHPLHIDLFLLVTARGEQMGLFFSLAALWLLLYPRGKIWLFSILLYGLALASKESAIVLPCWAVMVLIFIKAPRARYVRLAPWLLLTGLYWMLRQWAVGPIKEGAWQAFTFSTMHFPMILWHYAARMLIPYDLHFPRQLPHLSDPSSIYFLTILAGIGIWLWYQRAWAALALGWGVSALAVKIPAMQRGFLMDHWAYAAVPAFTLGVGISLSKWLDRPAKPWRVRLAQSVLLIGAVALLIVDQCYINLQSSEEKTLRWALHYEDLYSLRFKLAAVLWKQGRNSEALPLAEASYHFNSQDSSYANLLALVLWNEGKPHEAMTILESFLRHDPHDEQSIYNLKEMQKRSILSSVSF